MTTQETNQIGYLLLHNESFIRELKTLLDLEAERSGVLQGCLPSANCSAGAGADAQPDSLISSVVPREESDPMADKWLCGVASMCRAAKAEVAWSRELHQNGYSTPQILTIIDSWLDRVLEGCKPSALPPQGERAIPRNEKVQR